MISQRLAANTWQALPTLASVFAPPTRKAGRPLFGDSTERNHKLVETSGTTMRKIEKCHKAGWCENTEIWNAGKAECIIFPRQLAEVIPLDGRDYISTMAVVQVVTTQTGLHWAKAYPLLKKLHHNFPRSPKKRAGKMQWGTMATKWWVKVVFWIHGD